MALPDPAVDRLPTGLRDFVRQWPRGIVVRIEVEETGERIADQAATLWRYEGRRLAWKFDGNEFREDGADEGAKSGLKAMAAAVRAVAKSSRNRKRRGRHHITPVTLIEADDDVAFDEVLATWRTLHGWREGSLSYRAYPVFDGLEQCARPGSLRLWFAARAVPVVEAVEDDLVVLPAAEGQQAMAGFMRQRVTFPLRVRVDANGLAHHEGQVFRPLQRGATVKGTVAEREAPVVDREPQTTEQSEDRQPTAKPPLAADPLLAALRATKQRALRGLAGQRRKAIVVRMRADRRAPWSSIGRVLRCAVDLGPSRADKLDVVVEYEVRAGDLPVVEGGAGGGRDGGR